MKKLLYTLFIILFIVTLNAAAQNGASVNNNGSPADPSAMLDVSSTTAGMLIPRMTTAERDLIAMPAEGLQVFNTTTKCFEFFAYGIWQTLVCATPPFICGTSSITFNYLGGQVTYGTAQGQNGSCWLDRNLGASSVATSVTDINAYGDLFQWGRLDDGHQLRTSLTTTTLSSNDVPGHDKFISTSVAPNDWRTNVSNNLWQGSAGINNPCPPGWRVPVNSEINTERLSWSPVNITGAYNSPLKWTAAGYRGYPGVFYNVGSTGFYWTSTIDPSEWVLYLEAGNANAAMWTGPRGYGFTVRCIKD